MSQSVVSPISYVDFVLPPTVVSRVDLSRLINEFERVDSDMTTAAVRTKAGSKAAIQLALSEQLKDFLNLNQLRPVGNQQRMELIAQLRLLKDTTPVLHMTFATAADTPSLQYLAQWVRASVHPQAVIEVGVQPALIAGVYLRTPNHVHDMSLRHLLQGGHEVLVKELETLRGGENGGR